MATRITLVTVVLTLALLPALQAEGQWVKTNAPFVGKIIDVDQDAGGALYVSTERQMYRRQSDETAWEEWPGEGIHFDDICFNQRNVILALGEAGMQRSTDAGQSWLPLDFGLLQGQLPQQHRLINFGDNDFYVLFESFGVLRSGDDGLNWSLILEEPVTVLEADRPGHLIAVLRDGSVLRSSDRGDSWERATTTLSSGSHIQNSVGAGGHIVLLNSASARKLWHSSDRGISWRMRYLPDSLGVQKFIAIADDQLILIGETGAYYRSDDFGAHWQKQNTEGPQPAVESLLLQQGDLFCGTEDDGVYRLLNGTNEWQDYATGIPAGIVSELAYGPQGQLYAVTRRRVFVSLDRGSSWQNIWRADGKNFINTIFVSAAGTLLLGTNEALFTSHDEGQSWRASGENFEAVRVTKFALNSEGLLFAAAGQELLHSSDEGRSWELVLSGLPYYSTCQLGLNDRGHIYVGTCPHNSRVILPMRFTTNKGQRWERWLGEENMFLFSRKGEIIMSTGGSGLLHSSDWGLSMRQLNYAAQDDFDFITSFALDSREENAVLATRSGTVLSFTLADQKFLALGALTLPGWVSSIIYGGEGRMYAATGQSGVYRYDPAGPLSSVEPGDNSADTGAAFEMRVGPQPLVDHVELQLTLRQSGHMRVTLYDALGRPVATLLDADLASGRSIHTQALPAIAPGAYFIRGRSADALRTSAVVVRR